MTAQEIKKAFETFKKELFKETGIKGGFVMNFAQIKNRTATCRVACLRSFDDELSAIERCREIIDSTNWKTPEQKAADHKYYDELASEIKEEKAQYGTPFAYARAKADRITGSKSFAKFVQAVGGVRVSAEIKTEGGYEFYYIRFDY